MQNTCTKTHFLIPIFKRTTFWTEKKPGFFALKSYFFSTLQVNVEGGNDIGVGDAGNRGGRGDLVDGSNPGSSGSNGGGIVGGNNNGENGPNVGTKNDEGRPSRVLQTNQDPTTSSSVLKDQGGYQTLENIGESEVENSKPIEVSVSSIILNNYSITTYFFKKRKKYSGHSISLSSFAFVFFFVILKYIYCIFGTEKSHTFINLLWIHFVVQEDPKLSFEFFTSLSVLVAHVFLFV